MEKKQKDVAATGTLGGQRRDVMGKEIFGNRELGVRFLRGYVDLPFLKDIQAEDIEAFDQRHHFFDSVELNADTVKKVRLGGKGDANKRASFRYLPILPSDCLL